MIYPGNFTAGFHLSKESGRRLFMVLAGLVVLGATAPMPCPADEAGMCRQLAGSIEFSDTGRLLPPETRDAILQCGGLAEAIEALDQLDRDPLLWRAFNKRDFADFINGHTETSPPVAYGDLAATQVLKSFHGFVRNLIKR